MTNIEILMAFAVALLVAVCAVLAAVVRERRITADQWRRHARSLQATVDDVLLGQRNEMRRYNDNVDQLRQKYNWSMKTLTERHPDARQRKKAKQAKRDKAIKFNGDEQEVQRVD